MDVTPGLSGTKSGDEKIEIGRNAQRLQPQQ
jgi:hypothetical protein